MQPRRLLTILFLLSTFFVLACQSAPSTHNYYISRDKPANSFDPERTDNDFSARRDRQRTSEGGHLYDNKILPPRWLNLIDSRKRIATSIIQQVKPVLGRLRGETLPRVQKRYLCKLNFVYDPVRGKCIPTLQALRKGKSTRKLTFVN